MLEKSLLSLLRCMAVSLCADGAHNLLEYNVKEKICDENDNLIKRTTSYLNTVCKLYEPRKLLINLCNTRNQVQISLNLFFKRDLVFRRETWHLAEKPDCKRDHHQARIFSTLLRAAHCMFITSPPTLLLNRDG